MHDAWFITELQEVILSYCTSGSLSALARTSKSLKDSALNQLWADIQICQLLDLLPPDARSATSPYYWMTRELEPEDVATFSDYAKRVTHLRLSHPIHHKAIEGIIRHLPKPICPKLRSLTSQFASGDAECDFIIQLLGPHLNFIDLYDCHRIMPQSAILLFSYIGHCHPSIEGFRTILKIRHASSSRVIHNAILDTTVQLTALSHLRITSPNQRAMAHIADSKTLKTLEIRYFTRDAFQPLLGCGPTRFTNLARLSLRLSPGGIPSVCHLVSAILPERLQLFSITVHKSETSLDDWETFLQKLAQHHASTMQIFSASYRGDRPRYAPNSSLEYLLAMRNITDIKWRGFIYPPNNYNLERMAIAWPNLRRFTLDVPIDWARFASLTRNFPQLEELQATVTDESGPRGCELEETNRTWPNLRTLILKAEMTSVRLADLAQRYPRLNKLQVLRTQTRAVKLQLEDVVLTWPNLHRLTLQDKVTIAGFAALAKVCPNLEEVHICLEDGVHLAEESDRKVKEITSALPRLRRFKLAP